MNKARKINVMVKIGGLFHQEIIEIEQDADPEMAARKYLLDMVNLQWEDVTGYTIRPDGPSDSFPSSGTLQVDGETVKLTREDEDE